MVQVGGSSSLTHLHFMTTVSMQRGG
jgi:hypothetical protein